MIEPTVDGDRGVVGIVPQKREPLGVLDHAVKAVAMQDKVSLAIGGRVNGFIKHSDPTKSVIGEVAKIFIMVARHIDNSSAFARLAQNFLNDVVVGLRPIPSTLHAPAINDIADQVQIFAFGVFQKIEQKIGLAPFGAQMDIRNPNASVSPSRYRHIIHG